MAQPPARTTFIVAADRDAVILEKLAGMEQAIESLVPLLEQIHHATRDADREDHGPHGDLRAISTTCRRQARQRANW